MTGTFSNQCSAPAARAAFQKYAESLERAAGTAIFWVCVDEVGVFGRVHQHALIGNVQQLSRATWERRWRYGHARILCYDPGRGAAYYVTKYIAHPNSEFMLSDHIEAFRRTGSELYVGGSNRAWDRGEDPVSGNWHGPEAVEAGLANSQLGDVSNDVNPVGIARNCQRSSYEGSFPVTSEVFHNRARSSEHRERAMKMTTAKVALKGKGLVSRNAQDNLAQQARELDRQIRSKLKEAQRPLIDLGRLMREMRESGLWKYLGYRGWEHYVNDVMGSRARSSLHEIVAAYSLTQGSNPIPPEDVNAMGVKRAAQLARLKPEQLTPEIREMAKTEPVMAVRNKVQAVLNQTLPPDEQKPMLKLLAINLPDDYVAMFEELMEIGVYMVGIRDGDNTQTMRAKVFHSMLISFREYMAP